MSRVGRGNVILSDTDAMWIREQAKKGYTRLELAATYKVSTATIFRVIHKLGGYK